jgi:DmsE family decaheme c-type cytochrome
MSRPRMTIWSKASLEIAALMLMRTAFPTAAKGDQDKSATAPAKDSQYVGAETCKGCHEDIFKNFEKTPHWKTTLNKTHPEWQGCEGCHGPGAEHVAGGGDKSKIFTFKDVPAEQVSKRCMSCHEYGEEHANFDRSQHNINAVNCIACHSPHHAKEPQFLLVEKQPQLCFGCHTEIKQDFSRPFRHRVEQGLIRCTDCHNQHGGFLTKQLRATAAQDQVCFKCHVDKAGPFAFEHVPVKTEGCVACHQPHGSTNPRLLKRSQTNLLCLECHTLTQDSGVPPLPSFHNQTQKYQACTMCHVQIHGSNFDEFFFK